MEASAHSKKRKSAEAAAADEVRASPEQRHKSKKKEKRIIEAAKSAAEAASAASAAMAEDAAAAASTAAVPPAKKSKSDFADLRLSPDSPVPVETLLARGELSLESLNEGDELYLVQVPVDASNKTLEGLEVDLSRNVSRLVGSSYSIRKVPLKEPLFAVLPSSERASLAVAPLFTNELRIEKPLTVPDVKPPAPQPSDIYQPANLEYRLKLFGSDAPVRKKKSKSKKSLGAEEEASAAAAAASAPASAPSSSSKKSKHKSKSG